MATGNYGIKRPADVTPSDVEVFLHYASDRDSNTTPVFKKLTASDILSPVFHNDETGGTQGTEMLGGLYNLTLPSSEFTDLGVYNLYLRPKEIRTSITDCGVLLTLPNVKGLIFDVSSIPSEDRGKFVNNGLVGYRIEYLDDSGSKISNFYRVITSSFFCEPIVANLTNTNQKSLRYRYTSNPTSLVYCTVTPSTAPTNNSNEIPFIGEPNQNVILTNTYFNPVHMEVELVEHDEQTLAYALYGNQTKSIEDGIYTIYDKEKNIFRQYNLFEIRDEINNKLYEVREDRIDDIDTSKGFDNIAN
tara:strand:+ start:45343 stop:46251 length:909 start_codon:yes stop_codon:yes gene_type:complete